jgi:ribose 5-phosphate isomerase A
MTIIDRALDQLTNDTCIGLGSGRTAQTFVRALGDRVRAGIIRVQSVATSEQTAALAKEVGVPLITLDQAPVLDATVDGADEVDPHLDLIKGYGRALVREKIVAASSRRLIILVSQKKLVPRLGTRRRLPVEVVPFSLPFCQRKLEELGFPATPYRADGALFVSDNGNYIVDVEIAPIENPIRLERILKAIPGVVETGFFLNMTDLVLVGADEDYQFVEERKRDKPT